MKKKEPFEILVVGKSGLYTKFIRKTWRGVILLISKLETECPNIWEDSFRILINGIESETVSLEDILED